MAFFFNKPMAPFATFFATFLTPFATFFTPFVNAFLMLLSHLPPAFKTAPSPNSIGKRGYLVQPLPNSVFFAYPRFFAYEHATGQKYLPILWAKNMAPLARLRITVLISPSLCILTEKSPSTQPLLHTFPFCAPLRWLVFQHFPGNAACRKHLPSLLFPLHFLGFHSSSFFSSYLGKEGQGRLRKHRPIQLAWRAVLADFDNTIAGRILHQQCVILHLSLATRRCKCGAVERKGPFFSQRPQFGFERLQIRGLQGA